MFIISLSYIKPLEIVEEYLQAHRTFLDDCYSKELLVASGPKNPRTGGIIISQLSDRNKLESILEQDPFYINQIADYEITEFNPVKWHKNFNYFIEATV